MVYLKPAVISVYKALSAERMAHEIQIHLAFVDLTFKYPPTFPLQTGLP